MDIKTMIETWEQNNLNSIGKYTGEDLRLYGFPYDVGEYVPVHTRYSAVLAHHHAMTAKRMSEAN